MTRSPNEFETGLNETIAFGIYTTTFNIIIRADITYVNISGLQSQYNLASALGNPSSAENYYVTIESGTIIYSSTSGQAAFNTGSLPLGTTIVIENNGRILGRGGDGGPGNLCDSAAMNGQPGDEAIYTTLDLSINNTNGEIWGGGGGGGGGYHYDRTGQAGSNGAGNPYTVTSPSQPSNGGSNAGGKGGTPGVAGNSGGGGSSCGATGSGGAAGEAIITNGNTITWIGSGSVLGSVS